MRKGVEVSNKEKSFSWLMCAGRCFMCSYWLDSAYVSSLSLDCPCAVEGRVSDGQRGVTVSVKNHQCCEEKGLQKVEFG